MRSCSLPVLMHETAEQVASVDLGRLILAGEGWSNGWIRWLQPERPVRPVGVVVLDVDSKDLLEVAAANDQQPVQALGADRPDPALGVGVPRESAGSPSAGSRWLAVRSRSGSSRESAAGPVAGLDRSSVGAPCGGATEAASRALLH
jgi:hypothetical protein